ncbi:MAG: two-component system response regulator [Anaerolineaceae bacterium 4572_32.1]|nr:MAG: two-component system response regulator [Anaerolineaceae bacterium 4572_32.1]
MTSTSQEKKFKILVAEDEEDIRELVYITMNLAGYEVLTAKDGQEVLALATEFLPDLILMDVRMPKMTGYEACAAMKEIEELKDIPVVFLSAKGQEAEIQKGLAVGAVAYILKPFAPAKLTMRVQELLSGIVKEQE